MQIEILYFKYFLPERRKFLGLVASENVMVGMVCSPSLKVQSFSFSRSTDRFWKSRKEVHRRQRRVRSLQVSSPLTARQALQGGAGPLGHPHILLLLRPAVRPQLGSGALARPLKAGARHGVLRHSGDSVTRWPRPSPCPTHFHPLCTWTFLWP